MGDKSFFKGKGKGSKAQNRLHVFAHSGVEYEQWRCNYVEGCSHGCTYCYSRIIKKYKSEDWVKPEVVPDAVDKLRKDLEGFGTEKLQELVAKRESVMMSSSHDPLDPEVVIKYPELFRELLAVLNEYGIGRQVMILSKASYMANPYLIDIYNSGAWFGQTITTLDPAIARAWEPYASLPANRLEVLKEAQYIGIPTWCSIEPLLPGTDYRELILTIAPHVKWIVVGSLQYNKANRDMDWPYLAQVIQDALVEAEKQYHCRWMIKRELKKHLAA